MKYREVRHRDEVEQSKYAFGQIDLPAAELHRLHRTLFDQYYFLAETLVRSNLLLPALDYCLKCSHMFNLLDSSGGIGVTERMAYILRVRQLAVSIAKGWVGEQGRTTATPRRRADGWAFGLTRSARRLEVTKARNRCLRVLRAFVALRAARSAIVTSRVTVNTVNDLNG